MNCPFCGDTTSKVTNKRDSNDGIRRRRECLKCAKRYTTYEIISKTDLYVIKKDNTRELFDISKIENGLDRVFLKRPISKAKIDFLAKQVEEELRRKGKKEIKTKVIGELLMRKLKRIDKVAYIRFASVYREYSDLDDFVAELDKLNKK